MKEFYQEHRRLSRLVLIFAATVILTVSNYTKVFMSSDTITRALYGNSVSIVISEIVMRYYPELKTGYGLNTIVAFNGADGEEGGITDPQMDVQGGYCTSAKQLVILDNEFSEILYAPGNTIHFFKGGTADIVEVTAKDGYLYVTYDAEEIYSSSEQGNLAYATVYNNEEGYYMQAGNIVPYESQIGLQGIAFSHLPVSLTVHQAYVLGCWILAALFSVIITLICYELSKKYNPLFGTVFYLVTLFSPWMIGFSTNCYWVEFTWFLPMLIGLICVNHLDRKPVVILCCAAMLAAVGIKSACGYEYITTVMLGGIVFLLTDLTKALIEHKDKQKIRRLFGTTFFMGLSALIGFAAALLIHANIRGNGDIVSGLKNIYYSDVLRRTFGNADMFQDIYADSLNASIPRVVLRYLRFDTQLVLGVTRWAFIPLILLTFGILLYQTVKKKTDKQYLILFIWLGITAISWFVLGKAHSYLHTGINFVMWYFGFMQFLFYVPIQQLINMIIRRSDKWKKSL
jgi:hypothetical protein